MFFLRAVHAACKVRAGGKNYNYVFKQMHVLEYYSKLILLHNNGKHASLAQDLVF